MPSSLSFHLLGGGGVVVRYSPPMVLLLPRAPGPACLVGGCQRLASAAYVDLPHWWRLVPAAVTVAPLDDPPESPPQHWSVQVLAATICVAYNFEVVRQAKVLAIVLHWFVDPVCHRLYDGINNPEPLPYMHMRGQ